MGHKAREARNAYGRKYYAKHKATINARRKPTRRGYYLRTHAKQLAYWKARRIANREAWLAEERAFRAANRERLNREAREWYARNQEKQRQQKRDRYEKTKTVYRAYQKAYVLANYDTKLRPHLLAANRKYRKSHPEKVGMHAARRRARKRGAIIDGTADQFIASVRAMASVPCAYCKQPINGSKAHIDHIVSLSRGGSHTASNLCASCPRCNLSKHNRLLSEWTPRAQPSMQI